MNDSRERPQAKTINGLIPRDANIMRAHCRYGQLDRQHLEALCFQDVSAKSRPRVARRRKASLRRRGFLAEEAPPGVIGQPQALSRLTEAGKQWCDATFNDPLVMAKPTNFPQPFHQNHTLRLVDTHILARQAARKIEGLRIHRWIIEHEIVNYWETEKKKRHTMRLPVQKNPSVLVDPDAGMHFSLRGVHGEAFIEEDCCTISAERVARIKSKGFAGLAETKRYREFHPESTARGFRVLLITTKPSRRDRLCDALAAYDKRPDLWLVASKTELTPEAFFTQDVWRTHDKQPATLLPKSLTTPPSEGDNGYERRTAPLHLPDNEQAVLSHGALE